MPCRQAFDAADPATLVSRIENDIPATPISLNAKIHPAVSALVMKALAKDPAERYQSARELADDLEKCKESGKKAGTEARRSGPVPAAVVNPAARAAAASKFVSAASSAPKPQPPAAAPAPRPVAPASVPPKPVARVTTTPVSPLVSPKTAAPAVSRNAPPAESKSAAAAAGAAAGANFGPNSDQDFDVNSGSPSDPVVDSAGDANATAEMLTHFDVSAPESEALPSPVLSSAVADEEAEQTAPRVAVDPMMAAPPAGSTGTSFSDLAEMPPLKEPVYTPPVHEPVEPLPSVTPLSRRKEEKPRVQPREVAEKALQEIATVPPRLMLFSILGALALILVIALVVFFHVRSEDDGSTAAPQPTKAAATAQPVARAQRLPHKPPNLLPSPSLLLWKRNRTSPCAKKGVREPAAAPPRQPRLQFSFQDRPSSIPPPRALSLKSMEEAIQPGLRPST